MHCLQIAHLPSSLRLVFLLYVIFVKNGKYLTPNVSSVNVIYITACISKYSGGAVEYYPSFHAAKNRSLADKLEEDLRRYFTRKIGFEAVMRIRCTKGE